MITLLIAEREPNIAAFNPRFLLRDGFGQFINEVVVLVDSDPTDIKTGSSKIKYVHRKMNNNFVEHFNHGLDHCTSDWVFVMGDDEIPPPAVLLNGLDLIQLAANYKAVAFPRANWWMWQDKEKPVLWPDFQHRMIRRGIRYAGDVHERLDISPEEILTLPEDPMYTITHLKTQQMQEASGKLYDDLREQGRE